MNVQFQICGLLILTLFFIFYKSHKTLRLYTERLFFKSMCIVIICLVLDVVSLFAIRYKEYIPDLIVNGFCKLYLASLIWTAKSTLVYILTDVLNQKKHRKADRIIMSIGLIQCVIMFLLPIHIHDQNNELYTYGAADYFVYGMVAIYLVIILSLIKIYYKKLNPRRAFAIVVWMIIWIVGAVIQFVNNGFLIVGFAGALGVTVLFVLLENPEAKLDREFGCFNSYALGEYLSSIMEEKKRFGILSVSFKESNTFEDNELHVNEIMRNVLSVLKHQDDIMIFKNINLGFVIISENEGSLDESGKLIEQLIVKLGDAGKNVMLVMAKGAEQFDKTGDIFLFFNYIDDEYGSNTGKLFVVNDKVVKEYKERNYIEEEIQNALEQDRVEVHLQPIYSIKEQCFTSAEALVRIRKNTGELIPPGMFIPVAEKSGQILGLGERVFEKVCEFLKREDVKDTGLHYVEINLSVIQCEQENLAQRLIEIVDKYGVNPHKINLEITETASIGSRQILLKNMETLMEHGFTFSLDDFGKGESNLMYIVEMPVSIVKLDYDMSKAFFKSAKARHVVDAVVGMAHKMRIMVVAEGIELKEEADTMIMKDIDYIQGYYYSKPLPMEEAVEFLKNR